MQLSAKEQHVARQPCAKQQGVYMFTWQDAACLCSPAWNASEVLLDQLLDVFDHLRQPLMLKSKLNILQGSHRSQQGGFSVHNSW